MTDDDADWDAAFIITGSSFYPHLQSPTAVT